MKKKNKAYNKQVVLQKNKPLGLKPYQQLAKNSDTWPIVRIYFAGGRTGSKATLFV
jgi:hypothetical protein